MAMGDGNRDRNPIRRLAASLGTTPLNDYTDDETKMLSSILAGVLTMALTVAACMALFGCASSPWRSSYMMAATIDTAATSAHAELWVAPATERLAKCDVPEVETRRDFDACMEPYTVANSGKVLVAIKSLHAAQLAHSAVLSATDPAKAKRSELIPTAIGLCKAARELVAAVDSVGSHLERFDLVTAGMCKP